MSTTWHIYTLIDSTTAEIKPYQPGDQVHEIINAINAARLALLRERLAGLEPVTTPRQPNGNVLATSFFALREDN